MMNVPHKDKLRLDAIEDELLIIHPPAPCGDAFDGLWVVCDYTLPRYSDYLSRDKDLRKAIDGAMGRSNHKVEGESSCPECGEPHEPLPDGILCHSCTS